MTVLTVLRAVPRAAQRLNARLRLVDERFGSIINVIFGTVITTVAVGCILIGLQVKGQAGLAARSCERSKEFSPYFARDYARRRVLPPTKQKRYEASIPRRC